VPLVMMMSMMTILFVGVTLMIRFFLDDSFFEDDGHLRRLFDDH
jgi:hypothetical protein